MNEQTNDRMRLSTLELLSPPVPRQNKAEEQVLKLFRKRECEAALRLLGNQGSLFLSVIMALNPLIGKWDDSESNWRKWRISTNVQRQIQESFVSSRSWPLSGSISGKPRSSSQFQDRVSDSFCRSSQNTLTSQVSGLSSIEKQQQDVDSKLTRGPVSHSVKKNKEERFSYPHNSNDQPKDSKVRRAEHDFDWTHVEVRTAARRDARLLGLNQVQPSSKSSFATLPCILKDGLFGPELKPVAGKVQRLPYFDTLSIKVLNSPNYPSISRSLRMCASVGDSGNITPQSEGIHGSLGTDGGSPAIPNALSAADRLTVCKLTRQRRIVRSHTNTAHRCSGLGRAL